MTSPEAELTRLHDLLADRCGEPLPPAEARELELLLARHPQVEPGSFERAAAALHLALLPTPTEELPRELRASIVAQAHAHLAPPRVRPASASPASPASPASLASPASPASMVPWLPWLVAAAAVLLLVLRDPGAPSDARAGYETVRAAADVLTAAWTPTDDPGGAGVTGEVLWSGDLQAGFLRFEGLPANDPREAQYQLWIFDADRPAEYPVDGGVFDVEGGEALVPIVAKVGVARPTLFAVTLERPGGVVVSTRERLLLTATPH